MPNNVINNVCQSFVACPSRSGAGGRGRLRSPGSGPGPPGSYLRGLGRCGGPPPSGARAGRALDAGTQDPGFSLVFVCYRQGPGLTGGPGAPPGSSVTSRLAHFGTPSPGTLEDPPKLFMFGPRNFPRGLSVKSQWNFPRGRDRFGFLAAGASSCASGASCRGAFCRSRSSSGSCRGAGCCSGRAAEEEARVWLRRLRRRQAGADESVQWRSHDPR